ncbi:hypothetical protein GCM10009838_38790 [Catenulispora subtropica]|uniref:Uncharacterized protein n=1 Tax=Catenulispora subtropica TaxID=450798 RepID=A0ABN2RU82_9ACTN
MPAACYSASSRDPLATRPRDPLATRSPLPLPATNSPLPATPHPSGNGCGAAIPA